MSWVKHDKKRAPFIAALLPAVRLTSAQSPHRNITFPRRPEDYINNEECHGLLRVREPKSKRYKPADRAYYSKSIYVFVYMIKKILLLIMIYNGDLQ